MSRFAVAFCLFGASSFRLRALRGDKKREPACTNAHRRKKAWPNFKNVHSRAMPIIWHCLNVDYVDNIRDTVATESRLLECFLFFNFFYYSSWSSILYDTGYKKCLLFSCKRYSRHFLRFLQKFALTFSLKCNPGDRVANTTTFQRLKQNVSDTSETIMFL